MLPEEWLEFVFPEFLRSDRTWLDQFGRNRRTYILGFAQAAQLLDRTFVEDVKANLDPRFAEDPRRYVPFVGWREKFRYDGEKFLDGEFYEIPPKEQKHGKCSRWGAYGKDQPEHAWLRRPMRMYDALKSIAALYDAEQQVGTMGTVRPWSGNSIHTPGDVSLHPAIFKMTNFDVGYFEKYLQDKPGRLNRLFQHCGLLRAPWGHNIPTFYEMANGLSATYRTCKGLKEFAKLESIPDPGKIIQDLSSRGTNRTHRTAVKQETRRQNNELQRFSADCAVEIMIIKSE